MFDIFRNLIENKKAIYIHKKSSILKEMKENIEEQDPLIKLFKKQKRMMEQQKFNWIHEAQIEKLNFSNMKNFLKNFIMFFNKDIDKYFRLTDLFKQVFPLDHIFLYFQNLNLSFGNKVYDESLRFKTQLLNCIGILYFGSDFIYNYKIKFNHQFDFDSDLRNKMRRANRKEILLKYENDSFSLKKFIYFLLDNYYPRVGWRWIGASHFIYYITLDIIVQLFELGFWTVQDFDQLLLKLYEISEVLISLEKNSAKDSAKLAENFNKELINGFSTAREFLTLIIIHSYQLLIDEKVSKEKLKNYKFYFNLIITRYIFNSTKIKKSNLRNHRNLKQILFYLNSANFEEKSNYPISSSTDIQFNEDFKQINCIFDDIEKIITETDISENQETKNVLFDKYLEIVKIFFACYNSSEISLEQLLTSKFLKKIVPIIDIFKNAYEEECGTLINLTYSMINHVCLKYPSLLKSDYFKLIIKDFFEIEPFKNLYTISKLVTKNDLQINKYFTQFLARIFIRDCSIMMKLFNDEEEENINSSHEIFQAIMELFIKYFKYSNKQQLGNSYIELKMSISTIIKETFLQNIKIIFIEKKQISYDPKVTSMTYEEIIKIEDKQLKLQYVRTKEAYLYLQLYNTAMENTFKTKIFNIEDYAEIFLNNLCVPITNEVFKLYSQENVLSANNLLINRLKVNKNKNFILMENSFPITEELMISYFEIYKKIFDLKNLKNYDKQIIKDYLFEITLPFFYKFLYSFVFLNDENKVFNLEESLEEVIGNLTNLLYHVNIIQKNEIQTMKNKIKTEEFTENKKIYQILNATETSYTNYTKIKKICYNLTIFIKSFYNETNIHFISSFTREEYQNKPLASKFEENLEDIMQKIIYISSIDSKESMKNMLLYCIEEFRNCGFTFNIQKFNNQQTNFVFLREEYFDLLCMLKICFQKNLNFKKMFIDLIENEKVESKDKFFSKFWEFYRDTLFFSANNFFHNKLWHHISYLFVHLNQFMLQLTKDDLDVTNKILEYFFNFKLVTSFHNNHVLYFQIYVILECLGNYNKLLYLKDTILIEHKQTIFFVIENLFKVLSNLLRHEDAQLKIYVYRIDIWMNLLIRNIEDLDSPYYDLKDCLTDYFVAISGGEKPQIIKFYGANVNPEILKSSMNNLFELVLKKYDLLDQVCKNPKKINKVLQNNKIYNIIKKMYKFYNILIRHDVQTNYLYSFLESKIASINQKKVDLNYLLTNNLLFFYYAYNVYSRIDFQIEENQYSICEILEEKNNKSTYPLFIKLIERGEIKLSSLLDHLENPNNKKYEKINKRISLLLQLQKNKSKLTSSDLAILQKVKENDIEWIKKFILD